MKRRNIAITLGYDGTAFEGWQIQARGRTVQGVVQAALARFLGHEVTINAAGRTDSGVHANGQVINLHTDLESIPESKVAVALNSWLPHDVRAFSSREVSPTFHARFSARERCYRYLVWPGFVLPPYLRNLCVCFRYRPNLARLNRMAAALVGEHDFTTFSAAKDASESRVRTINQAVWYVEGQYLVFETKANAFLWRMVRSLVGSMIEWDRDDRDPACMSDALLAKDRSLAGDTAPAQGLYFHSVRYPEDV